MSTLMKRVLYFDRRAFLRLVRTWLPDLLYGVTFLLMGWKYTRGLDAAFDLGLYDETNYLHRGLQFAQHGTLPPPDWGPLYSFWYALLSVVQPDPVALYYLNHRVLVTLLAVGVYGALRAVRTPHWAAAVVAFWALIANFNVFTWPRVTLFALLIILGTLMIAATLRSPALQWTVAAFGALLAAYARPEYFTVTLWCLVLLGVWAAIRARQGRLGAAMSRRAWTAMGALIALGLLLVALLGVPVGGGERSMAAFRQHFSVNWVHWTNANLEPWTDHGVIIAEAFGPVDSIAAAAAANPALFTRHIRENVAGAFKIAAQLVRYETSLLRPFWPDAPWRVQDEAAVVLGLLVGGLWVWMLRAARARRGMSAPAGTRSALLLWVAAGYIGAGLLSVVLIYPRSHYLITVLVLLVIVVAALLNRLRAGAPGAALRLAPVLCLALFLLTPTFAQAHRYSQPNLAVVRALRALDLPGPVNLLEAQGGYHVYLGDHYHLVRPVTKTQPFDRFLAENGVNLIVLSDRLRADSRLRDDPEWQAFLADSDARGWQRLPTADTQRELLLAGELWAARARE